jgi:hypothetical protein
VGLHPVPATVESAACGGLTPLFRPSFRFRTGTGLAVPRRPTAAEAGLILWLRCGTRSTPRLAALRSGQAKVVP